MQAAPGEERLKAAREPTAERRYHVQSETAEQYRAPAEPIGEHSPEELP